jgi:hypothetical protein
MANNNRREEIDSELRDALRELDSDSPDLNDDFGSPVGEIDADSPLMEDPSTAFGDLPPVQPPVQPRQDLRSFNLDGPLDEALGDYGEDDEFIQQLLGIPAVNATVPSPRVNRSPRDRSPRGNKSPRRRSPRANRSPRRRSPRANRSPRNSSPRRIRAPRADRPPRRVVAPTRKLPKANAEIVELLHEGHRNAHFPKPDNLPKKITTGPGTTSLKKMYRAPPPKDLLPENVQQALKTRRAPRR